MAEAEQFVEGTVEEEEEEEEESVDYQEQYKEKCEEMPKCANLKEVLETCNDRVNSKTNTSEICAEELFDFVHCVDHCVSKNLFNRLK